MNTWPISTRLVNQHMLLGIPPRLGDGSPGSRAEWPSLEERVGEDWLEQLLARLLPRERAWLWWTRNGVLSSAKLDPSGAPARIAPHTLTTLTRKNLWLRRMSLIAVPANDEASQQKVLSWAGADTEQLADHLWTAPDAAVEWDLDDIASWCLDSRRWRDPMEVTTRPAERVVTLFGGYVFCAVAGSVGERLRAELETLAARWGLQVIVGAEQDAWVDGEP